MGRRKPLQADPVKVREWQQRGAADYQARRRERRNTQPVERAVDGTASHKVSHDLQPRIRPQSRSGNRKPRRNDGPWREECLDRRGRYCRACPPRLQQLGMCMDFRGLEVDHIWPRGQGGPSVVENGLVLGGWHHQAKTESRLLIRFEWLDPDQVAFLAEAGWIAWDDAGQPHGRGWKHFAPMVGAGG